MSALENTRWEDPRDTAGGPADMPAPKIRPDGWSQRENAIRALASLVATSFRRTEGMSVAEVAARRAIAAELGEALHTSAGVATLLIQQSDGQQVAELLGKLL